MATEKPLRHLSLVSTTIADKIQARIDSADWQACDKCGQEYDPRALVDGVCDRCKAETERISTRLGEVFNNRAMLIGMSRGKFQTTDDNSRAYIAARDFDPVTENLYLCGTAGTGKTMLACKVILQAIAKKQSCAFRITEEWLRTLYGASGQDQTNAINQLATARVLIFDEVGFEPSTEFTARALYEVINSRMLAGRNGMIVTSNLLLGQLAERLKDDRIPSRLGGMCGKNIIEITGKDWRQPE